VTRAYIGLGANLGEPAAMLRTAVEQLRREPDITVVAVSSVRETEPVGLIDQPRFLNAAVAVDTELRGEGEEPRLTAEALAERIGEALSPEDDT